MLPNLLNKMQTLSWGSKSYYCCSTGISALYITPMGDIYPCSRLITKEEEFKIGNITTGTLDMSIISRFKNNHIFNKKECEKCWAKYICGGQCYGDIFEVSKDIKEPNTNFCALEKHKIKIAGYLLKKLLEK